MFKKISLFISSFVLLASFLFPSVASADNNFNMPHFGGCPNPGGNVVASYSDGYHWIVGNSTLQWGSDTVYSIGNNNYVQCFCPKDHSGNLTGMGTQTYWIYGASLNQGQQTALQAQGWILVSDGSAFGLASGPYLAKNTSFSCSCQINIHQDNNTKIDNKESFHFSTGDNNSDNNTGGHSITITGGSSSSSNITNHSNFNFSNSVNIHSQNNQTHISISHNGDGSNTTIHIGIWKN